jgi:creatinine amidohydrolase
MSRPYILSEITWQAVKDTDFELAILPWGATEAHNYHLPYATDNIEAKSISAEAARLAWEDGTKVIVLPNIPYGVNTGQTDISLCMNIYPTTQMAILNDIVETLNKQKIRKLVILNSHGGNEFKPIIRQIGAKYPDMLIGLCNWYQWIGKLNFFEEKCDHADEMETSLLLYLTPQLVSPLDEAGDGVDKKIKIEAMREGWCWAERRWTQVTDDTGIGNPKKATAEKGELFFKTITKKIAKMLVELANCDAKNLYE